MDVIGLIYYIGLEFIAFILVDVIVKAPLRDAVNEQEKRTIWLYESAGLGLLCLLLYTFHHVPYLLLLLTSITFTCTQLFGRIDLSLLFASLKAHWENHLQHEENMKQIERQKQQQQHLQQQALGMAGLNNSTAAELNNLSRQSQQAGYGLGVPYFGKQGSLHYPPNATVVPGQDRPTYSVSPNSVSYHNAVNQGKVGFYDSSGRNWNNVNMRGMDSNFSGSSLQQLSPNAVVGMGRMSNSSHNSMPLVDSGDSRLLWSNNNLQRRSLHQDTANKIPKPFTSSSIKSKFLNVIGFGPSIPKPVGLVNNGQNICFINSTIQCLARGPFLVECLTADAAKELECSVAESELLSSLAELLDVVTVDPSCSDYKVFNASRFRKAASVLNPTLVSPPNEPMTQQDAAEFLMWLLETVHNILNKNSQALHCDSSNTGGDDKFSSPRLAKLKLIYGDLNANRIKDLKDQCRREIAVANGLENESYAEAIQRLSDLEWLTHKQANDTVVDGLFTGQLVEAYHSVEHGHISVNLQAFNILPVPMAPPRYSSGLVMLEDCFTSFCDIENLSEMPCSAGPGNAADGALQPTQPLVQISNFHTRLLNSNPRSGFNVTPVTRRTARHAQYGHPSTPGQPMAFPSPIPTMNQTSPTLPISSPANANLPPFLAHREHLVKDSSSGFPDSAAFRTSTPIAPTDSSRVAAMPPKLRRRCLLRQLPECLIIQLMRFRYDQVAKVSTKINTSVSIRLRGFNLRDVIYDTVTQRNDLTAANGGFIYELYGICLHLGANSTSHGHYVSYCLDGDKWFRMDDQTVEEVNMEFQLSTEEIRQNAYLLFYRRMGSDNV